MPAAKTPFLVYVRYTPRVRLVCQLIAIVLAAIIAQQSLSVSNAQQSIPHLDKVVHFIAYGALTVFALPALPRISPIWVVAGLGLFGGLIEIGQGITDRGRTADVFDAATNIAGAFTALLFWKFVTKLRP
ncbi:MAG: VanZ family protein [Acidimicrobiales bacterium]|nr:VanZ family protein [Hyphomonadaceae bacterium]RZV44815.1 MAG: VanZ family protein [Acidimicrobiales bacterium]